MNPNILPENIKIEYLYLAITILTVLMIYALSKVPTLASIKKRGLFHLISVRLERLALWLFQEFRSVINFLFGTNKDEIDEVTYNEALFTKLSKWSAGIASVLVLISFAGSFTASRGYAIENGISQSIAFGIPLAVDGFIILTILVIFALSLIGKAATWPKVTLAFFTFLSIIFNVSHIVGGTTAAISQIVLGGIFPLVVFVGTEMLSSLIREQITRKSLVKTNDDLASEIADLRIERDDLAAEIATMSKKQTALRQTLKQQNVKKSAANSEDSTFLPGNLETLGKARVAKKLQIKHRRDQVASLFKSGKGIAEIAKMLDYSPDTIRRDVKQLNGKVKG